MVKWVFLNDDFIEDGKAVLHYRDLSFQRGYGLFDFFRLTGNEPLFLEDHLTRFFSSAENMHLTAPLDRSTLKETILLLIKKNDRPDTGIRLSLTGGYSDDGFITGRPNLILSQHSFAVPSDEQRGKGLRLLSHPFQRQLPYIKTIDYLTAVWLQPLRIQAGADDILYHSNGLVTECPRSNFFLVTGDGRIVTPSNHILKGITRAKVIQLAKEGYAVEERAVHLDEIKTAKEAFVTSTTKQVLPVAQIDERIFTERRVGNELLQRFRSIYGG